MRRFRFRLERVLRVKRQKEKQAELRTVQARAAVDAARKEVATLCEIMVETAAAIEASVGDQVQPDLWLARQQHAAQIGEAIGQAEQREQQAKRKLREAETARAQIAKETETLVNLRKQQCDQHRVEAARNDQNQIDAVALQRWWSRQGDDSNRGQTKLEADRP